MKTNMLTILVVLIIGWFFSPGASAQEVGDFRSATTGKWSEASTWETYDGTEWVPASVAPTGSETISILGHDTVTVDINITITGYVKVEDQGYLTVDPDDGELEFGDGSTYEHARDAGSLPIAIWAEGSTFLLTGTVQDAPANRNQNFYHVTFDTPALGRNRDMGWNGITIGGNLRVISTGANRWQMSSVAAGDTATITVLGDLIIEDGQFAVQGTGNALTHFFVHHYGNIQVSGGNFSIARGSQGNGSGSTIWYLYEGNFIMSDATTQNSNPGLQGGTAKFVFAKSGAQSLSLDNVTFVGGRFNFDVEETTTLEILQDFVLNGDLINRGTVTPLGTFTVSGNGVYEHARNGGTIPAAVWNEGATARITGVTTSAPDGRNQNYYNLYLGGEISSNINLNYASGEWTIGGNLTVASGGTGRWQLCNPPTDGSVTVNINGNIIHQSGNFEGTGTGNNGTNIVINVGGDITVAGGNFSVARGSQGGEGGTGVTTWYLYGDFSMSGATTQNSNPWRSRFVFSKQGVQHLTLSNVTFGGGGFPVVIANGTTLDMGESAVGGNGVFVVNDGGVLATAHPDGIDGNLQTTGVVTINREAGIIFNGTDPQVPGILLPDSIGLLGVANPVGVVFSDTVWSDELIVAAEGLLEIDAAGSVSVGTGTINGTIMNRGVLSTVESLLFGSSSVYEHARDGGSVPSGEWGEGSTFMVTGTVGSAPGNRNQAYHNVTINTPDLTSNVDLSLNGVTIGGNVTVINTGTARWRLMSAAAGDTAIVTIMGDLIVEGGSFETQGTGNALTVFEVHHYGDVIVTGGNFSVARGSQGNGTGSTRWYLYEGDFSMSDATTQNSNPTNAWFVFAKEGTQNITLASVTYGGGGLAIEVESGTTLDFGISELGGNGLFVLNEDATLATAHIGGVAGTIQTTGAVTLDSGANFTFNGSEPQITSVLMPATVNNLTIDNPAGVALSQETTINGTLLLAEGEFDNTIAFILGPNGEIVVVNGTLRFPVSVERHAGIPTEFALLQNYPNPFNPSTTIRFDIPERTFVTLKVYDITGREVAELVNEDLEAGVYMLEWAPRGLASGVYYYRIHAGDFTKVRSLVLIK